MTPKNAHQKPRVVVLCGPHVQGAQGVNCGRQLVMHGVDVTLFVPNFMKVLDELQTELNLFELTGSTKRSFAKGKQIYYHPRMSVGNVFPHVFVKVMLMSRSN